jgi:hypothetical protein
MGRKKADPNPAATREEVIEFVARMMRSVRSYPIAPKVEQYQRLIEFTVSVPEGEVGVASDYRPADYDIRFNEERLSDLVAIYEQKSDPNALHVLISLFENALRHYRPIPKPMTNLVRRWVHEGKPKRTRASNSRVLGRNRVLVAAIKVLQDRANINPTRNDEAGHNKSGCDIVVEIWNQVAGERMSLGEYWPSANYDAAKDAWKEHRRGGKSPSRKTPRNRGQT